MLNQRNWQVDDVISESHRAPDTAVKEPFCRLLRRDVFSEGDSRPLYEYILSRRDEFSKPFLAMMKMWLSDEQKHYQAMRRVFHAVSGESYEAMDQVFSARSHEIEPIRPILVDEFTILVALAFDELGSSLSYRRDVDEYYRHYPGSILQVGKHLVADEGVHYGNCIALLRSIHSKRLHEAASVLKTVTALESSLGRYCQTFFLDHAQERNRFPTFFNGRVIETILFNLEQSNAMPSLPELWKWRPTGSELVPI